MVVFELMFLLPLLGAVTGLLAGLFGVGGGAVMVPVLTWLFYRFNLSELWVVHLALGTSMAAIIPTAIASLRAHHRRGGVYWNAVRGLAPGIILGSFAATFVASNLEPEPLSLFFFVFMCVIAWRLLRSGKPGETGDRQINLPRLSQLSLVGSGIGAISALAAIGGGTLTVPYLASRGLPLKTAIGSSAAVGLPIAMAGTLGYLWNGFQQVDLPAWSTGFVYWPGVLGIAATSLLTAPLGASLAHRLPVGVLRRLFALLVVLLALQMLLMTLAA
ncbi:UPF0721 transmembrane protein [Pseudohongiella nitratireducens]|jgi:uncharacterized membrane protein YfcA|uniref:Probable membrane transporter protein n=1 Tax=Pseudohongiella nitratireducens TaxID=1768907 RepID=A0A916QLP6_9GAMM|nr:sulfite exporter TauE/SafE family protein [Pseudohongiella nitratireducens]GFZ81709.1 UPF0721 transmembrane protein [Pseudohongiella nitratireducens]